MLLLLQMLESQVEVRQKEVEELQKQSQALSQEGKGSDEVDGKRITVENKFQTLLAPLKMRRDNLMASREIHQFNRDVEDEIVSPQFLFWFWFCSFPGSLYQHETRNKHKSCNYFCFHRRRTEFTVKFDIRVSL